MIMDMPAYLQMLGCIILVYGATPLFSVAVLLFAPINENNFLCELVKVTTKYQITCKSLISGAVSQIKILTDADFPLLRAIIMEIFDSSSSLELGVKWRFCWPRLGRLSCSGMMEYSAVVNEAVDRTFVNNVCQLNVTSVSDSLEQFGAPHRLWMLLNWIIKDS